MSNKPIREKPLPLMYPGATAIDEDEKKAVMEVLNSMSLFRYYGPKFLNKTKTFEEEFAKFIGTEYALGLSSGTGSLITALVAADVGPGDEVLIPAYCWISDLTAVLSVRAVPVIVEIDKSLGIDPEDMESKITERTKAVDVVHMRGIQAKMDEVMKVAKAHGLTVIEDAAQSCGGSYKGKRLGSIGDIGCYSFQLNKIITAGEGGAIVTSNRELFERGIMFHDMVALIRADYWGKFKAKPIIGINFRMNEITAAILIEQLKKIDKLLSTMKRNKERVKKGASDIDGIEFREVPDPNGDTGISLMFFLPNAEKAKKFAEGLKSENINNEGYGTFVVYEPERPDWHVYAHWTVLFNKNTFTKEGCPYICPLYKGKIDYRRDMCKRSLDLLSRTVHMDISPLLTDEDIEQIIEAFHKVAKEVL